MIPRNPSGFNTARSERLRVNVQWFLFWTLLVALGRSTWEERANVSAFAESHLGKDGELLPELLNS